MKITIVDINARHKYLISRAGGRLETGLSALETALRRRMGAFELNDPDVSLEDEGEDG
jgi:hypothetical protein